MSELEYENYENSNLRKNKEYRITSPEYKITSPVPGIVREIYKRVGDKIKKNEIVALIESMKTYIEIRSEEDGIVTEVSAKENKFVQVGGIILKYLKQRSKF